MIGTRLGRIRTILLLISCCFEPAFKNAHQTIQNETNDADGEDTENDVGVVQSVVLLPEETTDARSASEHFGCDNHEPRDTQTEAKTGEHVREGRGDQNFEEHLAARETQHFGYVEVILRDGTDANS